MKIIRILSILMLFCLLTSSACAKDQTAKTNKQPATNTFQVTFIELGSVNCVPCKMMQPVMKQIEKDYAGIVKVVFYDVWTPEHRSKASEYGIRAIPTQVFLDRNGKEFFRHMGYFSIEDMEAMLTQNGIKKKSGGNKK